jgi:hypothetical protein
VSALDELDTFDDGASSGDDSEGSALGGSTDNDEHVRGWFIALLVGLAAAFPFLLWCGRERWFFLDEWVFLVNRKLTEPSSLLEAHNGHWVTLPAVVYRLLFRVFGLRSYTPYLASAVIAHIGVVVVVWLTMRRLRVRPAIATLTALPFALYGAGQTNILFGFQIALTGSIVLGLAHLLAATEDAPSARRDLIGVLCGLGAIMCSAVGIPIIAGVALAVLLRRGWRAAAFHAVPLGLVYIAWYIAYGGDPNANYNGGTETLSFVWTMGKAVFVGLGQSSLVGLGLATVAAVGVVRACRAARVNRHSAIPSTVAALLVSAAGFAFVTGVRAGGYGAQFGATDRYVYVAAALLLPLVALGAEALARHWTVLGAVPLVLLLIGLPGNIDLLRHSKTYPFGSREIVTAVAYSPQLDQLPADTRIFALPAAPEFAPTVSFLRNAAHDGTLPALEHPSKQLRLNADLSVAVHQTGEPRRRACPATQAPRIMLVDRGTRIAFSGSIVIAARDGAVSSTPAIFNSAYGDTFDVRAGPIELTISGPLNRPPTICRIELP